MAKLLIALYLFVSHFSSQYDEAQDKAAKPITNVKELKLVQVDSKSVVDKPVASMSRPNKKNVEDTYELYTLTAYSNHFKSTGKRKGDKGYGITKSGRKTKEGITIAADYRLLPEGSIVWIEGVGKRRVDDTGSAIKGRKIDVYFDNERDAIEFGKRKKVKVKVISVPEEN